MATEHRCKIHGTYTGNVGCPFCKTSERTTENRGVDVLSKGARQGVKTHSKSEGGDGLESRIEVGTPHTPRFSRDDERYA